MPNKAYRVALERAAGDEGYGQTLFVVASGMEQVVKKYPDAMNITLISYEMEVVILREAPKKRRKKHIVAIKSED